MLTKSKAIALITFGLLMFWQQAFCQEKMFFEKVAKVWTDNQKDPTPILKQVYEKTKNDLFKSKKSLKEAALNIFIVSAGVTIGVCAGIYIYEKFIKSLNNAQNKDKEKLKTKPAIIPTQI